MDTVDFSLGPVDGVALERDAATDELHRKNLEIEKLKKRIGKQHKLIVMQQAELRRLKNINGLQAADLKEYQPEEESALEYWLKQFE